MNVKLIGKHEKDSRACRDALALTLDEMMAEDKSICYVDCDLMSCINTKRLREHYPDRAFQAGIAEGNAAGVAAGKKGVLPLLWYFLLPPLLRPDLYVRRLCGTDGPRPWF